MTSPVVQVTPVSLRTLAQLCEALASQVAPHLPTASSSAWQASGTAASTVNAETGKAAAAMRLRMTASARKLTTAAQQYEAMDHNNTAALAAVPTGGAGFIPLAPGTGTDGGSGGLEISR